jgi:hypothetical protein
MRGERSLSIHSSAGSLHSAARQIIPGWHTSTFTAMASPFLACSGSESIAYRRDQQKPTESYT